MSLPNAGHVEEVPDLCFEIDLPDQGIALTPEHLLRSKGQVGVRVAKVVEAKLLDAGNTLHGLLTPTSLTPSNSLGDVVQHRDLEVISVVVCAKDAWVLDTQVILRDMCNR